MFGTYHLPAQGFPASYGAERRLPATWTQQLLSPFFGAAASVTKAESPEQSAER
ncbi:MAG: hypothetical protein ABI343_10945 [Burkholderiaceae bacterium]